MADTIAQFEHVISICRDLFVKKLKDYGASWRIMHPQSVTDQIFIKAKRIRSIETKGESKIDEGVRSELIGIVNYGIIGLIQLHLGYSDSEDITVERALDLYDKYMTETKELMYAKNHDYDEAWRSMRISSYTDLILTKICRTKQIENNNGKTLVSEGVDANYMDMINYSLFGLIKIEYGEQDEHKLDDRKSHRKKHGKRRKEIEMKRRKIILKLINRAIGIDSLHEPRKHKRSAYDQAR